LREDQSVEWKKSWQDDYLKWICGFANAQGGCLVLGKDDAGKLTGLAKADKLMEDLPNKIRDLLGIMVQVNRKTSGGKDYLEIEVDPYPSPISLRGRYYIRSGATNQELKGPALDRFMLGKLGRRWDDIPVPHVTLKELDSSAFDYFREAAAKSGRMDAAILNDTDKAIVDNLKLREGKHLRNAGVLLFHKNPEQFIPGAYIKLGFFRSESDLAYQDEVYGNLFVQAQKTLDLLMTKYMKAHISYEGVQRIDRFLFPRDAIREVLHNALAHRDYSTGTPIQIRVYEDHVRFYNNGHLPDGWTIKELLKEHMSEPYNPLIANAFFRTGDIEAWGRGIAMIRDACRKNGTDFPTFEFGPTSMMVEFTGTVPTEMTRQKEEDPADGTASEGSVKTSVKASVKTSVKTSVKILEYIAESPETTIPELAEVTGVTTRSVERNIKKLQDAGKLRRVGPAKGGHWKVLR